MKYISALLSHLRPVQMLLSTLLCTMLFFASGFSTLAAKNIPTKGTVQLDKIEQKAQKAIDSPAMSLETIEKRSQGGLNEVQGDADRDKMNSSNDPKLPVVKQAEKALSNIQKS
ncbi:low temperature-induced protein [Limnofasciculus baicalensis]|uniref:Low temperature-induced protein n=1 Tax=Limnofasciculus baicalensis BBK-W-15 TaxID=2699891 RepID=A0AAE3KM75_9CYAN|nr:low temperature-induced protein [Limnofasciculus baicalensis]MCP2727378.1 low temperature-induced protein [Limnofasciculus baicalensis BBK-W-15]